MVEGGGAPVIVIDETRCDGCGLCLGACPEGALYLVENKAVVDGTLCLGCGSCIVACPTGVLALSRREGPQPTEATRAPVPVSQAEPPVIRVNTQPAPVPLRSRLLPVVGATLAWAGREIVPRLADYALDRLDRWAAESGGDRALHSGAQAAQYPTGESPRACRGERRGGGRRQRRRWRGS